MSEPSLPTTPINRGGKRNLKKNTDEGELTPVTAEKQRYGKNSTRTQSRGRGRPPSSNDDGQSLEEFFATPKMAQEKKQTPPVSYQRSSPPQHAYAEDTPYRPHLDCSPPVYLYQRPDSPNYVDVPSSPVLPPRLESPSFSRSASFRRRTGSPRPPHTGPPIFDPQHHNDWLHRNLVGKNVVSSPDKSAVPLTDDLPRIPILPVEQYTLVQRIKFVNQCLINAGFPRVGDYLLTLTTETFNSHRKGATNQSKKCTNLQLQEWTWGLPNLLKNLDDFVSTRICIPAWTEKLKSYKANVVDSASTVLESEFRRFAVREDTRRLDPTTKKKEKQSVRPNAMIPSYLQLRAL